MVGLSLSENETVNLSRILDAVHRSFQLHTHAFHYTVPPSNEAAVGKNRKEIGWMEELCSILGWTPHPYQYGPKSVPIYWMSVFQMPVMVIERINYHCHKFLWRHPNSANKGIHLASWDQICRPRRLCRNLGPQNP